MKIENSLNWIESTGGSLMLAEEHLLNFWQGAKPSKINFPGDYDRACDVDDFIGLISINNGYGLVFGDEPLWTAFLPASDSGSGLVVRWVFAINLQSVIAALQNTENVVWKKTGVKIHFSGNKLILFDSSCSGNEVDKSLEIEMPEGFYEVETADHKADKFTSLLLHRFILLSKDVIS